MVLRTCTSRGNSTAEEELYRGPGPVVVSLLGTPEARIKALIPHGSRGAQPIFRGGRSRERLPGLDSHPKVARQVGGLEPCVDLDLVSGPWLLGRLLGLLNFTIGPQTTSRREAEKWIASKGQG